MGQGQKTTEGNMLTANNDLTKQLTDAIAMQEKAIAIGDRRIVAMIAARDAEDNVYACDIAKAKSEGSDAKVDALTDLSFARREMQLCEIENAQMNQELQRDHIDMLKVQLAQADTMLARLPASFKSRLS
jgi:hypothetical protein